MSSRFTKQAKTPEEFVAAADIRPPDTPTDPIPITAGLGSTGFDASGIENALAGIVTTVEPKPEKPWVSLDPNGAPRNSFNLRLNDHDLAILRYLAALNKDLSMQKVVNRILVPELHRRVGVES